MSSVADPGVPIVGQYVYGDSCPPPGRQVPPLEGHTVHGRLSVLL